MKVGLHGGQRPTETILGNPIQSHYHKRGIGDEHYVVVENQPIENLEELIAELVAQLPKPKRKRSTSTKENSSDES